MERSISRDISFRATGPGWLAVLHGIQAVEFTLGASAVPDSIMSCIEEEYSLFLSILWRRRNGWHPLLMYFRGPGGVPFFIVPFLTLIGLWRFARRPPRLADADTSLFLGVRVTRTSAYLGSYGMGGPGFVGLRLRLSRSRCVWVVFTVWAAAGWLTINDDLLLEGYLSDEQRALSSSRRLRRLPELVGSTLTDIHLDEDLAELNFSASSGPLVLRLRRDSSALPVHRGSKQPKVLGKSQDIRDAVIISRRGSLWLED
ncbi:MAG: hypothetical protein WDZ63_13595 [Burkholderiales bacterium]